MAVQLSLAENGEAAKRRAESRASQALETVADGSCQFVSICFTAGIPVDPADFRSQVVNFLRHLPQMFADKITANFTSFEAYLQNMSRPSTATNSHFKPLHVSFWHQSVSSQIPTLNQNVGSPHPLPLPQKFGGMKSYYATLVQITTKPQRLWLKAGAMLRRTRSGSSWSDKKELDSTFDCLSALDVASVGSHLEPILYRFSCPHPGSQRGR